MDVGEGSAYSSSGTVLPLGRRANGGAMALKKCSECEGEVSSKAKTCPHCGAPAPKEEATVAGNLGALVVLNEPEIEAYCATYSVSRDDPKVRDLIKTEMKTAIQAGGFRNTIREFEIVDGPWEVGAQLTPTLKLVRGRISDMYELQIAQIYDRIHG